MENMFIIEGGMYSRPIPKRKTKPAASAKTVAPTAPVADEVVEMPPPPPGTGGKPPPAPIEDKANAPPAKPTKAAEKAPELSVDAAKKKTAPAVKKKAGEK
mgnify:CR=1 FL=1